MSAARLVAHAYGSIVSCSWTYMVPICRVMCRLHMRKFAGAVECCSSDGLCTTDVWKATHTDTNARRTCGAMRLLVKVVCRNNAGVGKFVGRGYVATNSEWLFVKQDPLVWQHSTWYVASGGSSQSSSLSRIRPIERCRSESRADSVGRNVVTPRPANLAYWFCGRIHQITIQWTWIERTDPDSEQPNPTDRTRP